MTKEEDRPTDLTDIYLELSNITDALKDLNKTLKEIRFEMK